jgi:adenine-specific DNA-methyltransferase
MAAKTKINGSKEKRVTRYAYDNVTEPRTPETGHTALLPADEQVVALTMDNGWSKAISVGKLSDKDDRPVVIDMDPAADPVLFWSGKRNSRQVPILPLQRNEIVTESRIGQIIERARKAAAENAQQLGFSSIFADLEKNLRESDKSKRVEFYTHDEGWKNKLICGDSLHLIESLIHYEGMRGNVQMIYIDPPYGIRYDSNFQQRIDSTKNDDKDEADDVLTIKAYRDTWTLGVHSYLSYLTERLYLCRELLSDTGSIFFQINQENLHLAKALLAEIFGASNEVALIVFTKTSGFSGSLISSVCDYLVWFAKDITRVKYSPLYRTKNAGDAGASKYRPVSTIRAIPSGRFDPNRLAASDQLTSQGETEGSDQEFQFEGKVWRPPAGLHWKTTVAGLKKLAKLGRIIVEGKSIRYVRFMDDFPAFPMSNVWTDVGGIQNRTEGKLYAVQTAPEVIQRCILMTTEPGELVFDPTCGSGSTAYCAEALGRRWITCDTSRVAINIARKRLLSATFAHYKTRNGHLSSGFAYKSIQRVTLKSLANDMEPEKIDLVDEPEIDGSAVRVCGSFEVMSLGRYSVEDWKGYVSTGATSGIEPAKLENYIEVICRLYRKDAAVQGASGLIHAIAESRNEKIAISVGPLSGRVTAKQVNDAVQDALASGILEVHILGWAFEANVGEVKAQLEKRGKLKIVLQMIRPDTLSEGLKATQTGMLFSPLALPDIEVLTKKNGKETKATVRLKGVAVFDRKNRTTDYKRADSGYVSAWYLDEDYDGDCFVDCQMFFDFKKAPNLKSLGLELEPDEYSLQLESQPFAARGYKRIAVKVVDVFGNESTVVREL